MALIFIFLTYLYPSLAISFSLSNLLLARHHVRDTGLSTLLSFLTHLNFSKFKFTYNKRFINLYKSILTNIFKIFIVSNGVIYIKDTDCLTSR